MIRCSKCVLPSICPKINFDEKGICNVCRDFDERWGKFDKVKTYKRKELEKIFIFYRNKGGKYDCLVPFSGGLDSTYVLYVCKRIFHLNVLAFNFDNGFQTEIAKHNVENAVKKLGVDFVRASVPWEKARILYALFYKKTGEFCTPCNLGIWSMSYKIAKDLGIPLIVSGSSDRIRERLPNGGRIYSWSPSYFREVIKNEMPEGDVKEYLHLPRNFHNPLLMKVFQPGFSRRIRILPLFDYIDYDIKLMLETLKTELNWKQSPSRFHHIDCIMETVNDYFKQKKWGFSAAPWYSMLVRIGQLDREKALEMTIKEEERNSKEPPELTLWLKLLDLSKEDINGFEKRSQHPYVPRLEKFFNSTEIVLRKTLIHSGLLRFFTHIRSVEKVS